MPSNTVDLTRVRQLLAMLDAIAIRYPYLVSNTPDNTAHNTWQANDVKRILNDENDNVQFPNAD